MKRIIFLFAFMMCACSCVAAEKVDIDLSKMNITMAYSSIANILMKPDNYLGKTIKIRGLFDSAQDSETGIDYFAVALMDATACCAMGLDFSPKKEYNYKYPEDFPAIGSNITVVGKFEMYREGEDIYYQIGEADIIK